MNPITVFLTVACLAVGAGLSAIGYLYAGVPVVIAAIVIAFALKMANSWQKFVILRAGKLRGVKGPGLFLIIPVIDRVVAVIDERIQTVLSTHAEARRPARSHACSAIAERRYCDNHLSRPRRTNANSSQPATAHGRTAVVSDAVLAS